MKSVVLIFFSGLCLTFSAAGAELAPLEDLVSQWVDLRGQIAQEKRDWQQQRDALNREIELQTRELKELDKKITADRNRREAVGNKVKILEQRKQNLADELSRLDAVVDRTVSGLSDILKRVPSVLKSDELRFFDENITQSRSVVEKLQRLLAAMGELEKLENSINVTKDVLEVDGVRREMDVLYFGLAYAFAVSADDSVALSGRPLADGWQWHSLAGEAQSIRRLINFKSGKGLPQLVKIEVDGAAAEAKQ